MKTAYLLGLVALGGSLLWQSSLTGQNPAAEADYSAELPRIPAKSIDEAVKCFDTQPGFRVELVVAEPPAQVTCGLCLQRRWFLVRCREWSTTANKRPSISVASRDWKMSITMAAWISVQRMPKAYRGQQPSGRGRMVVLVAEPPKLLWLGDTNGDGVSDVREVWYDGFGRGNVQGLVNSPALGPWMVTFKAPPASSGADLKGGEMTADAGKAITLRGRDFSLDPLSKTLEPASGGGQHGMCFNRLGRQVRYQQQRPFTTNPRPR